eukprot:TRINITY_DN16709_c0_g1_i1.p1 TRINITY_DN16709_c0_g1~~TRINITY_DN16709_c0_g1_i1.p1  ORF type:complete len:838 (+),score=193.53 TRINITY_DN16709_c0_g1_i1:329-2515(+)
MESAKRVEERMKFIEDRLIQMEQVVQKSTAKLYSDVQTSIQDTVMKVVTDVALELHEQSKRQAENLELSKRAEQFGSRQCQAAGDAQEVLDRLEKLAKKVDAKLDDVSEVQQSLKTAAFQIAQQVQQNREQDSGDFDDLKLALGNRISQQGERLEGIKNSFDMICSPIQAEINKTRRHMTYDARLVLDEIARIQKALNVDYVSVSKSQRFSNHSGKPTPEGAKQGESVKLSMTNEWELAGEDDEDDEGVVCTRVREFYSQTDPPDVKEGIMQTDPVQFETQKKRKETLAKPEEPPKKAPQTAFSGADKLKKQAKANSMKRPYNVFDYYHDTGIWQRIAKHRMLDNLTLVVVMANAIWLAVDTDMNNADMLYDAHPVFIIAENAFCGFFFLELFIRFMAFRHKSAAFQDAWFVFDLFLASFMVLETWVLPGIFKALNLGTSGMGALSALRTARLARLARLTRMVRLLKAVPELLIIVKGLIFAARSVVVFFFLWCLIVFAFAIVFRQITGNSSLADKHFSSVPEAMNTLLMHGVFGERAEVINEITALGGAGFWPLTVFFFCLVSVTTMYMLVGVLVDVVGTVATCEKEALIVKHLASQMRLELEKQGYNQEMTLTQQEFQNIMMLPGILTIVQDAGVDVSVLADMLELICEDVAKKENGVITFPDLVEIVLSMRGDNAATVKDCKEQIRVSKAVTKACFNELTEDLKKEFASLRQEIRSADYGGLDDD